MRTRPRALLPVLLGAAVLAGTACAPAATPDADATPVPRAATSATTSATTSAADHPAGVATAFGTADPDDLRPPRHDPGGSLTTGGAAYLGRLDDAPVYELELDVDPVSGDVVGSMVVDVPAGEPEATFRWFPNLPDLDANADLADVEVDGRRVEIVVDDSIVRVPLEDTGDRATVSMSFTYRVPRTDTSSPLSLDGGLELGSIGLLGRTDDVVALGHWYPVWLDGDVSADPDPDGYGDIGNFPAAMVTATVTAPPDATVVTGGVLVGGHDGDGREASVETFVGAGFRDLAVVVMSDPHVVERTIGVGDDAVTVRVTAPATVADTAGGEMDAVMSEVMDETVRSVEVLSEAFTPYPWRELDVVAVPLGSGVGGMEWPGMIWVEPTIFAGSLPGIGDLGGMFGGDTDVLGGFDVLDVLGPLLGDDVGLSIETMRAWVVAHEVAHMWWHALVGNDSVVSPIVDEPLAQHAACLVLRDARPLDGDAVCEAHTFGQYRQLVGLLGVRDAPADQPTTDFDSAMQYGAVVYGKAPGFYLALEAEFGVDSVTAALAAAVDRHAFERIDGATLVSTLADELPDAAAVHALWDRWMNETHGRADVGAAGGGVGSMFDIGSMLDLGSVFDAGSGGLGDPGSIFGQGIEPCVPITVPDHPETEEN